MRSPRRWPGFNTANAKVTVTVGGAVNVDLKMDVAGTKENVNVVAEIPRINVTNSEVATTITETQIRELPTITRNVYDLVAVAGNVSGGKVADGEEWTTTTRGTGYNINGQRASGTNILLDGSANNNEFDTTVGQDMPLDSVQEFSVVTSNFSAQYGRATGGIVNVVTKSGTNSFRGTGYEFYRSDKLATNTFDNKANEIEKGEFTRHQLGFSVGGPIRRDKLALLQQPRIHPRAQRRHADQLGADAAVPRSQRASHAGNSSTPTAASINGRHGPDARRGVGHHRTHRARAPSSRCPRDLPVFGRVEKRCRSTPAAATRRTTISGCRASTSAWATTRRCTSAMRMQDQEAEPGTNSLSPYDGFDTGYLNKNHNILASLTQRLRLDASRRRRKSCGTACSAISR